MVDSNVLHGLHSEIDDWLSKAHRAEFNEWRLSQNGHNQIPRVMLKPTPHGSNDQQRIYAACAKGYSSAS
jgi:hypothetical protein